MLEIFNLLVTHWAETCFIMTRLSWLRLERHRLSDNLSGRARDRVRVIQEVPAKLWLIQTVVLYLWHLCKYNTISIFNLYVCYTYWYFDGFDFCLRWLVCDADQTAAKDTNGSQSFQDCESCFHKRSLSKCPVLSHSLPLYAVFLQCVSRTLE